jgi:hypothetical protein
MPKRRPKGIRDISRGKYLEGASVITPCPLTHTQHISKEQWQPKHQGLNRKQIIPCDNQRQGINKHHSTQYHHRLAQERADLAIDPVDGIAGDTPYLVGDAARANNGIAPCRNLGVIEKLILVLEIFHSHDSSKDLEVHVL